MIKNILSRFRSRPNTKTPEPPPPKAEAAAPATRERSLDVAPRQPTNADAPAVGGGDPPKRRRRRRKPAGERTEAAPERVGSRIEAAPEQVGVRTEAPTEQVGARTEAPPERAAQGERRARSRPAAVEAVTGPQPRDQFFGSVAVSAPVSKALTEMGYIEPTPIQQEVILPMSAGDDLVGQAQTGTGKTAGFGIPLAENVDGAQRFVQAIILVPTRELARQVTDELTRIFRYRGISAVAVYGGAPIARQIADLEAGGQVVVGTPGRVIDLLNRGNLRIDRARTVVLDEADQMLDIGFLPDIRRILRQTSRDRQTALFTATVPTMIRRLIYSYLREPKWIRVGEESEPVETVRQLYCEMARQDKLDALLLLLKRNGDDEQTLIFRRTQEDVEWLVRMLKRKGVSVDAIHGGLRQAERNAVMQAFRDGKLRLLVSTNLTSRGIDVPAVAHVINYDIPEQVEEYVHRIGRTARMGRDGTALTFVSEWDVEFFDAIRDHVGADRLEQTELVLYSRQDVASTG